MCLSFSKWIFSLYKYLIKIIIQLPKITMCENFTQPFRKLESVLLNSESWVNYLLHHSFLHFRESSPGTQMILFFIFNTIMGLQITCFYITSLVKLFEAFASLITFIDSNLVHSSLSINYTIRIWWL